MSKAQYLDRSQYNRLFPYMQYENALALRIALETGLRIGDVLSICKGDIKDQTIHYVSEKTGKRGKARISKSLADELMRLPGEAYLFPKRYGDGHRTRQAVYIDMERAVERAQLEKHVSPHSSRKTFAVDLMRKTGNINDVKKALQHSNADTSAIYAYSDHEAAGNCYGCFMAALPQISRAIAKAIIEELTR